MDGRTFSLEQFCASIGATAKERSPLRQDLVRGLKDYYEAVYGYDRYGAETIFQLEERMGHPYIYGFAAARILRDRRISRTTKVASAHLAIESIAYGADGGIPHGIAVALHYLAHEGAVPFEEARYVLTTAAGEYNPFLGTEKGEMLEFFGWLLANEDADPAERAFWGHSLLARHGEAPGAAELVRMLLAAPGIPAGLRRELCVAWLYKRQPRLEVPVPPAGVDFRSMFVAEHLPFWVAHVPSWPSTVMIRFGLSWLPRFGDDPAELVQTYIGYRDNWADQIHAAVADIIAEHHGAIPESVVKGVIEKGVSLSGSAATRRRFYMLGSDLYGAEYLKRATADRAGSVRQWASRQIDKDA